MTSTNQLEFKGNIARHPVDELLVEFMQKNLTGSLRLSSGNRKSIVYFDEGKVVFVISNARAFRLYAILLGQGQIEEKVLGDIKEFTNDMHLAKMLVDKGHFTKRAMDSAFSFQFGSILKEAFTWTEGNFIFSASARIKADMHFDFDVETLLRAHVASIAPSRLISRLGNQSEKFQLREGADLTSQELNPQEAFILSRLGSEPISADTIQSMCGFESEIILPALYRLWLGGSVIRSDWSSAISQEDTSKLTGASFELKQAARSFEEERAKAARIAAEKAEKEAELEREFAKQRKGVTLDEYLKTVEEAATHYEIFDISPDAKLSVIKKSYFALAKRFHPDLFHREVDAKTQARVQSAFTEIAQAYETLKDPESREVYDFKLRKVIEQLREAQSASEQQSPLTKEEMDLGGQASMAEDAFDNGYEYLLSDKIDSALPFLGRAAHIEPKNARYRAFYGRALSFDSKSHRKAETEYQQAISLEPDNLHYRQMLAELFIDIGHKVRARGELNRILEKEPNNKEARHLLDTLED